MNDQNKILDILKEAISIEIYGKEYYSIFSELVEEENAKSIFSGLARDEGEHRELLEKEYRKRTGKKPGAFSPNHLGQWILQKQRKPWNSG
jgi:rubrerythrin